jgi:hypothetical protein
MILSPWNKTFNPSPIHNDFESSHTNNRCSSLEDAHAREEMITYKLACFQYFGNVSQNHCRIWIWYVQFIPQILRFTLRLVLCCCCWMKATNFRWQPISNKPRTEVAIFTNIECKIWFWNWFRFCSVCHSTGAQFDVHCRTLIVNDNSRLFFLSCPITFCCSGALFRLIFLDPDRLHFNRLLYYSLQVRTAHMCPLVKTIYSQNLKHAVNLRDNLAGSNEIRLRDYGIETQTRRGFAPSRTTGGTTASTSVTQVSRSDRRQLASIHHKRAGDGGRLNPIERPERLSHIRSFVRSSAKVEALPRSSTFSNLLAPSLPTVIENPSGER